MEAFALWSFLNKIYMQALYILFTWILSRVASNVKNKFSRRLIIVTLISHFAMKVSWIPDLPKQILQHTLKEKVIISNCYLFYIKNLIFVPLQFSIGFTISWNLVKLYDINAALSLISSKFLNQNFTDSTLVTRTFHFS